MEILNYIADNQYTWGVLGGLLLIIFVWNSNRKDKKGLRKELNRITKENTDLQTHLGTQLKINAKGNETLQVQLTDLKQQNETLRVNIQTIQQKPGKVEQRKLDLMEIAVSNMREQAPGFAAAWEKSIRSAEEELQEAESGFKKLIHKIVPSLRTTAIGTSSKNDDKTIIDAES